MGPRIGRGGGAGGIAGLGGAGVEAMAGRLAPAGGSALAVAANITEAPDRERLVETTIRAFGRIDVLVNNAGIMQRMALQDVTYEVWHRTMQVNLDAAFFCSQAVLSVMRERGKGRIVNISSM